MTCAINVTPTISVGFADSYVIRIEMTVVGISVMAEVFSAKNVTIERLAESFPPFNSFNCSIALIPSGVAAFPNPKKVCHHIG